MDPYTPELWHDFFLLVGSGSAALTGLVVVAMSLHLDVIVGDLALRHRARSILTGLAAVFMRCALVLMGGQTGQAVAAELFVVSLTVRSQASGVFSSCSGLARQYRAAAFSEPPVEPPATSPRCWGR